MQAGCSSRRPTRFFASPKKWGKKGDPYDGGPLRGLPASPAPETGSVRNSLRSDSGRFFIRFRHWRRGAINGDLLQRQRQRQLSLRGTSRATATVAARNVKGSRNGRCAERQGQPQRSLRGTSRATATVAARNVKGNRNGRCAERQGQPQRSLRGTSSATAAARHVTATANASRAHSA